MDKMIFAAAALSLALCSPALAQGSNQGTPNTLHGSGDMMQDGPHASSVPPAVADQPAGDHPATDAKSKYCMDQWKTAQANSTTGGQSQDQYMQQCLQQPN